MAQCLLGIGSNLGDRGQQLQQATALVAGDPRIRLVSASDWYRTDPIGGPAAQPEFFNAALHIETALEPGALLACLQEIEHRLDRRRTVRWGPRTIDLDLLLYDDRICSSAALTIPHPRMHVRRFVIEPAAQIAPAWVHPLLGWTLAQLCQHLSDPLTYVAVVGSSADVRGRFVDDLVAQRGGVRLDIDVPTHLGRSATSAIEWLQRGAAMLDRRHWPATALVISDGGFEWGATVAAGGLTADQRETLERQVAAVREKAIVPKLTIWLAELPLPPHDTGAARPPLDRGSSGPWLHLALDDPETALAEALAAIDGLTSVPRRIERPAAH